MKLFDLVVVHEELVHVRGGLASESNRSLIGAVVYIHGPSRGTWYLQSGVVPRGEPSVLAMQFLESVVTRSHSDRQSRVGQVGGSGPIHTSNRSPPA